MLVCLRILDDSLWGSRSWSCIKGFQFLFEYPLCLLIRFSIMGLASSDQISGWNVSHKLQKRKLLIAINCVAATSIFFFGSCVAHLLRES